MAPAGFSGGIPQIIVANGAPANTTSALPRWKAWTPEITACWHPYTFQVQPSAEAIEEIAVQTSNFAAEIWDHRRRGLFNASMRAGTNQFHGSLYDYNVNEAYNAGSAVYWPAQQSPPKRLRRQSGRPDSGSHVVQRRWQDFLLLEFRTVPRKPVRLDHGRNCSHPGLQEWRFLQVVQLQQQPGSSRRIGISRHQLCRSSRPNTHPHRHDLRPQ